MKTTFFVLFALTLASLATSASAEEKAPYPGRPITRVQSPDTSPCTFFQLNGVDRASNASASNWFAVPQSSKGYKDMIAMLLTAFATGKSITVETTGSLQPICGEAEVTRFFVN